MALRSYQGSGRYAASEQDVFISTLAGLAGGIRGVVYCHVVNSTATACRDYNSIGELHLVNTIAEVFPVLSIDAGGLSPWGNATAMARIGDAITYLQGTRGAKSGKVLLVGSSHGGLTVLNFAKANPTLVAAVVGMLPVIDLNDVVTNNRGGLAAGVNTAYGGAYSEVTNGPTSNPANYAASYAIPTQLYYASDDTTAIPSTVTTFASTATNVTATSLGALGHTEAAIDAAPRSTILAFLSQYA